MGFWRRRLGAREDDWRNWAFEKRGLSLSTLLVSPFDSFLLGPFHSSLDSCFAPLSSCFLASNLSAFFRLEEPSGLLRRLRGRGSANQGTVELEKQSNSALSSWDDGEKKGKKPGALSWDLSPRPLSAIPSPFRVPQSRSALHTILSRDNWRNCEGIKRAKTTKKPLLICLGRVVAKKKTKRKKNEKTK